MPSVLEVEIWDFQVNPILNPSSNRRLSFLSCASSASRSRFVHNEDSHAMAGAVA